MKHNVTLDRFEEGVSPIPWKKGKYVVDTSNNRIYLAILVGGEKHWVSIEDGGVWGYEKLDDDFVELKSGDSFTVKIDNS